MGKDIPRKSGQQPKCSEGVLCSMQYAFWYRSRRKTRCEASHIDRVGNTHRKGSVTFGPINRVVAAGCEIDKVTSAEIAFAIFIAKHDLPMAVGDEFGLLAKKMLCTTVPVAPPCGGKILTTAFSRFFVRSVPLFRSLMLTPMCFNIGPNMLAGAYVWM